MGWVKLDDGFFRHPKAIRAGRDGRILFIASMCYAGSGLTDGFVPDGALVLLGAETGIPKPRAAADALVAAGLWDRCDGGYAVHDYLDYNTSSGKVHADRDAARERMKRKRSPEVRPNNSRSSPEVREPETEEKQNTETERSNPPSPPKGATGRRHRIPDDFVPDVELLEWAAGKGFAEPEIAHHAEAFLRYWRSEGGQRAMKYDWRQAFQTWLMRETPGKWPGANLVVMPNGRGGESALAAVQRMARGEP